MKEWKNCIIRASENLEIFSDQLLLKIIFKSKIVTYGRKIKKAKRFQLNNTYLICNINIST